MNATNAKTTVIYHSADFDGHFCHQIARKFLGNEGVEYIGWDFGNEKLNTALLSQPLVVMDLPIDQVFGLTFRDGWICNGDEQVQPIDRWENRNITWIDHHKTSIETHPTDIPGYRIDGVSACRLAWQWFNKPHIGGRECALEKGDFINRLVDEPLAVRLVGERDIWDKRDPDADTLQYGLQSQELSENMWALLLVSQVPPGDDGKEDAGKLAVDALLELGRTAQKYQQTVDAETIKARSFMVEFEGLKFLALNTARCNSLTFAALDVPDTGHEALLGFFFNGTIWKFSLYGAKHRPDIDLSAIAKKYKGGGHRQACGFEARDAMFGGGQLSIVNYHGTV